MALAPITPRDRLERLVDLGRKTLRYSWLIAVFAVGGGALSLVFALTRARSYTAEAVLGYEEKIQSSVLSNREEAVNRFLGDRYRELLMARPQLIQVIEDPKLNPYPDIADPSLALEKFRQAVKFDSKGGANFKITFTDTDPDRAKAVTDRLTRLLQDKDEAMRSQQAQNTVAFATAQKEESAAELRKREQALAEFLAKHPEFAQDQNQASAEGAGIRAIRNKPATGNTRLDVLDRQRARLQARLDAPPDAPPIRVSAPPTPEKIAAEAAVQDAQREVVSAQRELEDALSKYTEKHPSVIKAQERVAFAKQHLREAKAAVPPDTEMAVAPATPADRTKIQKDLAVIQSQIADEQKRSGSNQTTADQSAQWVVKLETQYTELRRGVTEQRETVESLADSVRRAQIDASAKAAEGGGGRLTVINPAEKPAHPTGPGKTVFLLAGMVLFLTLGGTLAIGLAVIDDRLYRRADIDQLGIAVLAVIPPARIRAPHRPKMPNKPEKDGS
ncbi:MAG: lipopolysaccharide biosynthesis protein [Myxococcales bacterium]|nr:lipopolysaccharide biosynthesis protein [Myxococcales bacterium]